MGGCACQSEGPCQALPSAEVSFWGLAAVAQSGEATPRPVLCSAVQEQGVCGGGQWATPLLDGWEPQRLQAEYMVAGAGGPLGDPEAQIPPVSFTGFPPVILLSACEHTDIWIWRTLYIY